VQTNCKPVYFSAGNLHIRKLCLFHDISDQQHFYKALFFWKLAKFKLIRMMLVVFLYSSLSFIVQLVLVVALFISHIAVF